MIVDPCGCRIGASGRNKFLKLPIVQSKFVGMIDTVTIGVEANCDTIVIEAKQLVDRSCPRVGVAVRGEDAIMLDEAKVVAIAIDPEASRVPVIVDGNYLCLHRAWKVLIFIVVLRVGRIERVALVWMSRRRSTAEVARDDAIVVDPQQLIKGRISLVIQSREPIGCIA